ncbi:MAG: polyribonucleotide nucleotidyltransferase, partial [Xanthomonadales bacterium]|nr:polyribonucleotide nucleotidyltransferase [Xanthomonadales bacterium]
MQKISKSFQYGEHTVTIETGHIARQADAAVLVSMADTSVLVSVVARKEADEGRGFFPLTVNYQEKFYAAGRIPGGFFKREGRPTEKETLTSRLIDRPIRPLFPKKFLNEVQVIATLVSSNPEVDGDIPALIGASAVLALSGVPFNGPLGAARVGFSDGEYILNPSESQLSASDLDLVVAGTRNAVLMVESEAKLLSEEVMLGAVTFGHEQLQHAITAIEELAAEVGVTAWEWEAPAENEELLAKVTESASEGLQAAYGNVDKLARRDAVGVVRQELVEALTADEAYTADEVSGAFGSLEKRMVRERILRGEKRI